MTKLRTAKVDHPDLSLWGDIHRGNSKLKELGIDDARSALMHLGRLAEDIVAASGSVEAAVAYLARVYDLDPETLQRCLYDRHGSLIDHLRAGNGLPPMRRGRRGPASRLLGEIYRLSPNDQEEWRKFRPTLLSFAQASGDQFYRRVAPILRLSESAYEAAEAIINMKAKPRSAGLSVSLRGTWEDEAFAARARKASRLGLLRLKGSTEGIQISGAPKSICAAGFGPPPQSHTMQVVSQNVEASMRNAGWDVCRAEAYGIRSNGRIAFHIRVRIAGDTVACKKAALDLAKTGKFKSVEVQGTDTTKQAAIVVPV